MAEGTRAQVQLREMEDNWNARFTTLNQSVDDKLTAMSDSFSNKLDSKVTEVLEAIKLLKNAIIASNQRSPSMMQNEDRQSASFVDWTRTSTPGPDLLKAPSTEIRFGHDHSPSILQPPSRIRSQCLEFVASNRKSLLISPSSTIEALEKVESPQLVPLLLTTPVSMESNSAPQSPRLSVRKDDPPTDVHQEQLHHIPIGEGEFEQSVHPFKDNSEGRATHKGELSTFNHQDSNTKVVCESVSENDTKGVSIGSGSSCLTFGVNAHHHKVCKIDNIFEAKGGALKLFDKMPEPVSMLNMFGDDIFGSSSTNGFEKSGVINYVFDPGGQVMNEMKIEVLNGSDNERDDHAIVGHQLKFPRTVASINEKSASAEIDGARLRDEPFVFTIFDPGGAYGLLKSGCGTVRTYLPKLPIHWDLRGCSRYKSVGHNDEGKSATLICFCEDLSWLFAAEGVGVNG